MAINDPIADMLTRIRNGVRNRAKSVTCLNSKVCRGIAVVLRDEGYIDGFDVVEDGRQGQIKIKIRFGPGGKPVLRRLTRESRVGRRVYRGVEAIPTPLGGLGISIVSTSKGVLSDRKAKEHRVGGELLCTIE
ncbi:MAG: 30S ribosomal protein S8 [Phycisphaeraceae bacterium]|nr:30S ribosomal protein S8 [Phycisphaerae bacterium]MBX3391377.1 30S ribosomal protein S8 [Phycisphaeraceae bacterium]HRJ49456.1 30S ribosomal protein S8 [Phycisphaerales bacterium]